MNKEVTNTEIGKRISILRKRKGLSQEELASKINISRSALTQIELGKRSLSAIELYNVSIQLGFSIDEFLAGKSELNSIDLEDFETEETIETRISVPKLKIEKFKHVLLYILEKCAGKPNVGETLLYKLLYFADFNNYELHEEHLSGAIYRKLPFGPVPKDIDFIIENMIEKGELSRLKTEYHNFSQKRYIPLVKADLTKLKASEIMVIDKVIDLYSDWTATAISEYSHMDIPWMASEEGKEINYELVFYREAPYSVRTYQEDC